MNKKAQAFGIGMVLITIVLVGVTIASFVVSNRKVDLGISSLENLTEVSNLYDQETFYLQESLKLASQQAFYTIAKSGAVEGPSCFTKNYDNKKIVIWNNQCLPEKSAIEKKFLLEYNNSFGDFMLSYPTRLNPEIFHAIDNQNITTQIKSSVSGLQTTEYAGYNLSSGIDKTFIVNLDAENISLDDFGRIYQSAIEARECMKNDTLENCTAKISFERWDIKTTKVGNWILFELSTKKSFFFAEGEKREEQFSQIPLKFGIEI